MPVLDATFVGKLILPEVSTGPLPPGLGGGGKPPGIWGGGGEGFPTPPIVIPPDAIAPGVPTHPIYLPVYPAHPIVIPPGSLAPGVPTHPIVLPPFVPAHPIVIPPDAVSPGVPAHPIVLPPAVWPGPGDPDFPGGGGGGGPVPPDVTVPPPGSPPMIVSGTQPVHPMTPPAAWLMDYPGIGKVVVPQPTQTTAPAAPGQTK